MATCSASHPLGTGGTALEGSEVGPGVGASAVAVTEALAGGGPSPPPSVTPSPDARGSDGAMPPPFSTWLTACGG